MISSGIDTISQQTYGQARKKIQNAGVPVYSFGLMQAIRDYYYAMGAMSDTGKIAVASTSNAALLCTAAD